MSRKITEGEFSKRVQQHFPEAKFKVLSFYSIKQPAKVKCLKCGKEYEKPCAENFVASWPCCGKNYENAYERIKRICSENGHYEVVKRLDPTHLIIKHLDCGNEMKKTIQSANVSPCCCKFCQTQNQRLRISKEDAQKQLDAVFNGQIEILFFDGVDSKKSQFRCNKCGLIFKQAHYTQIKSCRGCPKCDQRRSKGERAMRKWLDERGFTYAEQVHFPELPRLSFDFGIYENENLKFLIEVQGEQHYRDVFRYPSRPNNFKMQQLHDEQKRQFCKEKNIPLFEIINESGKLTNLEILSNSTTISAKESKAEAETA